MVEEVAGQVCPICGASVKENARYPDYVCRDCYHRLTDDTGRPVRYRSAGPGHPNLIETLTAAYEDGTPYMSETCYIDGVKCHAREAHMGGVVVRPVSQKGPWNSPNS